MNQPVVPEPGSPFGGPPTDPYATPPGAPGPPPPVTGEPGRPRRRRRRRGLLAATVVVALAGAGLAGAHATGVLDLDPRSTPAPTATEPDRVALSAFYDALTGALEAQDREAFFARVRGAAVAPLNRWWDNMDAIGWTTGRIAPVGAAGRHVTGPDAEVRVLLGTDMRFGQYAPVEGGEPERVIHGFEYRIRVDVAGPEPTIIEFEPAEGPRPWDSGPLAVVAGDGVVLAALGGDRGRLTDLLAPAEEAATWVMDDHPDQFGREVPLDGFVVFVTTDSDRYQAWFGDTGSGGWAWEPAGYAFSGTIPGTQPRWAGAMVVIGPQTVEFLPGVSTTLVHEFAHVVQAVDHPAAPPVPLVATEGWAVYQELRFADDDAALSGYWAQEVAACLADEPAVPRDRDFRGDDAGCAYAVAATLYAYAREQGLDPVDLADATAADGLDPFDAAADLGVELTADDWAVWVQETFPSP